jgi:hypothetical protein
MMYDESKATEWFDGYTTLPDYDKIDAEGHWWCARHWAPCPLSGANGITGPVTANWQSLISGHGPLTILYVGPPKKSDTVA